MKRAFGALGAATVLSFALVGAGTAQAETSSAALNTAPVAPAGVNSLPGSFYTDGVNIRNAPNLDATVVGLGYRSHRVTVHCGTSGPLETYWWRITDNTTGVRGYIHQNYGGPSGNPGSC
ncbi:SH3 domain-containing protein [Streptomyces sp. NPDC032161]|uniref:SH3 domain-containing protein n=1 Tax=unclassified Streptomyces TaxID=2593676 RepID=UPI0034017A8E